MKPAAPNSSPTAKEPLLAPMAANVEKTSGLPLPKATKVTPATFSLRPNIAEMDSRFSQKKSLAAMPMVEKSRPSHDIRIVNATGFK
jgi:hypothetical protein